MAAILVGFTKRSPKRSSYSRMPMSILPWSSCRAMRETSQDSGSDSGRNNRTGRQRKRGSVAIMVRVDSVAKADRMTHRLFNLLDRNKEKKERQKGRKGRKGGTRG